MRSRPGKHTLVFDFTYDGPGIAKGGAGVLKVDDKEVANQKIPHTVRVSHAGGRNLRRRRGHPHARSTTTITRYRSASRASSTS